MLSTEMQIEIANLYFVQKSSLRSIAEQLGIHRYTVTKYLSTMQTWLDDIEEGGPDSVDMEHLKRAIEKESFTERKLTEAFLKFVERQHQFTQVKTRMELYQRIRRDQFGSLQVNDEIVAVDCRVGYSTFCKAIKIIEERTGKTLFPKRLKGKWRRRGGYWDD